jgi:hypothetical protein
MQQRSLSIAAMALYMSRGGLVWILNVVLLGLIIRLAVKIAVSDHVVVWFGSSLSSSSPGSSGRQSKLW